MSHSQTPTLPTPQSVAATIRNLDLAIRDAVKNGSIVKKLQQCEKEITDLFAVQALAFRQPGEQAKAILAAFAQDLFLFEFVITVGNSRDRMITNDIYRKLYTSVLARKREAVARPEAGDPRIRPTPPTTENEEEGSTPRPVAAVPPPTVAAPPVPHPAPAPAQGTNPAAQPARSRPLPRRKPKPTTSGATAPAGPAPDTSLVHLPSATSAPPPIPSRRPPNDLAAGVVIAPPAHHVHPAPPTAVGGVPQADPTLPRTIRPAPQPSQPPALPTLDPVAEAPKPRPPLPRMTPGDHRPKPARGQPGGLMWVACDRCKARGIPCHEQDGLSRGACQECSSSKSSCQINGWPVKSKEVQEERAKWVMRRMNHVVSEREEDEPPLPPAPGWGGLKIYKTEGGKKAKGRGVGDGDNERPDKPGGKRAGKPALNDAGRGGEDVAGKAAPHADPDAMDVDPTAPVKVVAKRPRPRRVPAGKGKKKAETETPASSENDSSSESDGEARPKDKGKQPRDIGLNIQRLSTTTKDLSARLVRLEDLFDKNSLKALNARLEKSEIHYQAVNTFDLDCVHRSERITEALEAAKEERQTILAQLQEAKEERVTIFEELDQSKQEREKIFNAYQQLKEANRVLLSNQKKLNGGIRLLKEHLGLQPGGQTLGLIQEDGERLPDALPPHAFLQERTPPPPLHLPLHPNEGDSHPAPHTNTNPVAVDATATMQHIAGPSDVNESLSAAPVLAPAGPDHPAPPASTATPMDIPTSSPLSSPPPATAPGDSSPATPALNVLPPTPVKPDVVVEPVPPRRDTPPRREAPPPSLLAEQEAPTADKLVEAVPQTALARGEPPSVSPPPEVQAKDDDMVVDAPDGTRQSVGESEGGARVASASGVPVADMPVSAETKESNRNVAAAADATPAALHVDSAVGHPAPEDSAKVLTPKDATPPAGGSEDGRHTMSRATPPRGLTVYGPTGAVTALAVPDPATSNFLAVPSPIAPGNFLEPLPGRHLPPLPTPSPPPQSGLRRSMRHIAGNTRQPSPAPPGGMKRKMNLGQDGGRSSKRTRTPSGDAGGAAQ